MNRMTDSVNPTGKDFKCLQRTQQSYIIFSWSVETCVKTYVETYADHHLREVVTWKTNGNTAYADSRYSPILKIF